MAQTVAEAVETTISEAISRGIVDRKLHAAPLAAMRYLAARADESVCAERVDNVSMPTLLKYLDALGIIGGEVRDAAKPDRPATIIDGGSRFASRRASDG